MYQCPEIFAGHRSDKRRFHGNYVRGAGLAVDRGQFSIHTARRQFLIGDFLAGERKNRGAHTAVGEEINLSAAVFIGHHLYSFPVFFPVDQSFDVLVEGRIGEIDIGVAYQDFQRSSGDREIDTFGLKATGRLGETVGWGMRSLLEI